MNRAVVFDIDGVLADYEGKLIRVLADEFGQDALKHRDKFSLEERFSDYPEILVRAKELTADPNFYYGLEADENAVSFLEGLHDNGFMPIFVTSRPESVRNFTYRWLLHKTTFNPINLFCGITDKAYFISELGQSVEFVVEDNPEQIYKLKEAQFVVLCWEQPWNEGIYPRLYTRSDRELMLWTVPYVEAELFWTEIGEKS